MAERREQPQRQVERRPSPRHVVVQIAVNRLIFQIQFGCQRQQEDVLLERREAPLRRKPGPGEPGRYTLGVLDPQRLGAGGQVGHGGGVCQIGAVQQPVGNELVHLLVAHIKAAEFVKRKLISDAEAQDLPVQQQVQPP